MRTYGKHVVGFKKIYFKTSRFKINEFTLKVLKASDARLNSGNWI
jgi:hypothetical protein